MKIIKQGTPLKKTCPQCKCEFEFDISDIQKDYEIIGCQNGAYKSWYKYLECPEPFCKTRISI